MRAKDLLRALPVFFLTFVFLASTAASETVLFKGARIVDGTGAPSFTGDVLVEGDRIKEIGEVLDWPAGTRVIDAKGMVLAPGFIDMHSHLDFQLTRQPLAENVVRQGVTTVVGGQCGFALAPQPKSSSMLAGYLAALGLEDGKLQFATLADYFKEVESNGTSVNLAMLAPHGIIRETAMGHAQGRPSQEQLEEMKALLEGAMKDGAYGMSTGLAYPPGYNSDEDELVELMKVAGDYGGAYFSHIRDEGSGVLDAVDEAIEIGDRAGVPVQISHVKAVGSPNYGKVPEVLAKMQAARDRGMDVTGDVYPYVASSTSLSAIMMPPSVFESGDFKAAIAGLKDEETRKEVKAFAEERMLGFLPKTGIFKLAPDSIAIGLVKYVLSGSNLVVGVYGHPEYDGKTFKEVKKARGFKGDVLDLGMDIIAETGHDITIISFMMDEDDVKAALASPIVMIGSDGMGKAASGQHPRSFGAFPRFLSKYAREEKLVSLEEAVHKMTGMGAAKLGLEGRGFLKEGYKADLVLFDFENVRDVATFEKTQEYPEGIEMVLVNGVVTVEGGRHTGAKNGTILRRQAAP